MPLTARASAVVEPLRCSETSAAVSSSITSIRSRLEIKWNLNLRWVLGVSAVGCLLSRQTYCHVRKSSVRQGADDLLCCHLHAG